MEEKRTATKRVGRPCGEKATGILTALAEGPKTARELAHRLLLSRRDASISTTRLRIAGKIAVIAVQPAITGVGRPQYLFALPTSSYSSDAGFWSDAIAAQRLAQEQGVDD